jgi:hypothetical protein
MSVYTGVTHSRLKAISLEADEATITRLNVTDSVLSARVRFTIAEVNAGATLVAAITGKSIRMVNCKAIAVGGAAGAVTTVDVLGTVSTARKLVAFAQASLTQSAVLTAGGTGAAVLADGASYTANDVSTGITDGKTGSNVTTATHIDVIFDYVVV